jgi:[NiFe] hydrogenase large subunit/hydrogenase large subunit
MDSKNTVFLPGKYHVIHFYHLHALDWVDVVSALKADPMKTAAHAWYKYSEGDNKPLHPWVGETVPNYTGPKPPYEFLDTEKKYSWVKGIRYDGLPTEVGPLSRMLVAYASGHKRIKEVTDGVLKKLQVGPEALFSTLGRTAARGIETLVTAEMLP